MTDHPFRQLHLDFHNGPDIPDVGAGFDPEDFAESLELAHVASVTLFSRCHHGLLYHDSERFSELRHPNLTCDLLALQLEACRARGIRAPIYVTVGWDDTQRRLHPEWLERDVEGQTSGPGPLEPGFTQKLCLNSDYVDFVAAQTEELLDRFAPVDGLFFDIVYQGPCCCTACLARMQAAGLDPAEPAHREQNAAEVLDAFKLRMTALVRERCPEATIFYNAGHIGPETARTLDQVTHLEIESLATGHWGYLHFPMTARYAATMGLPLVGMTANFHGTWGDLGAPKPEPALTYECAQMLSVGARCSVGDQLLPTGRFHPASLPTVKQVFGRVEALEPWCAGAEPEVEVGVLFPEAFGASDGPMDSSAAGALLALTEGHHQFRFIDGGVDFGRYKVIVVPDRIRVGEDLAATLGQYVEAGGGLILLHLGGLAPDGDRFTVTQVGARCLGVSDREPDYVEAGPDLSPNLPPGPLVMKWRAMRVEPRDGAEVLARVRLPHFDRTWRHFSGHQHASPAQEASYPAAVRSGSVIYFAHPLLSMYRQQAWPWARDLFLNGLNLLLPEPLVTTDAPRACQVTRLSQPAARRALLHFTCYQPRQIGEAFATIEEATKLGRVGVGARWGDTPPARVYLCPDRKPLSFEHEPPYVRFTVPQVDGHQVVCIEG